MDADVAVIGGGVVGCATALELARRGADVALVEAEAEVGLAASGTNSGIVHTGFDSVPGELETDLILRAAQLRAPIFEALSVPLRRCGGELRPRRRADREAIARLADQARANGVTVQLEQDGALVVPGEAITDPVAFTRALARAGERHGAELRPRFEVAAVERSEAGLAVASTGGERLSAAVAVNCAGLGAGAVAAMAGDRSFEVYPRKGEFLVFDPPPAARLERILLPVPTRRTKGVLVFPTLDGKVVAGPTAVDLERPDWSVRPESRDEILPKAFEMHPPLAEVEPVFAYAGLRPAGRGTNYVIGRSAAEPRMVHAAAIRSTGLTASVAIAERVADLVASAGVAMQPPDPLQRGPSPAEAGGEWWRRTAERFTVAGR